MAGIQGKLQKAACGGGGHAVVGIFDPWQLLAPDGLFGRGDTAQGRLQLLVCLFGLAIALRMISRGQTDLRAQRGAELFPHMGCELGTPVGHDVIRDACRRKTWLVSSRAVSKAVSSLGRATK